MTADCGADAVKFQTHLPDAELTIHEIGADEVYDTVTKCEWTRSDHEALQAHAADNGVVPLDVAKVAIGEVLTSLRSTSHLTGASRGLIKRLPSNPTNLSTCARSPRSLMRRTQLETDYRTRNRK